MAYRLMYAGSVLVAVLLAIIGAVQVADPIKLGISAQAVEWLKIVVPGLGILAGVLPSVRKPPSDPRVGQD